MDSAPAGADVVIELDLARLRQSPVLGSLVRRLSAFASAQASAQAGAQAATEPGAEPALPMQLLMNTDAVLMAAYHVGEERAQTLTLLRVHDDGMPGHGSDNGMPGHGISGVGGIGGIVPVPVADGLFALAPPEWLARIRQVRARAAPSLRTDRALMAVRARAMPKAAPGAFLRVAARLGFNARVSLAERLDLDRVPMTLSLWADVADDLAVVATLQAEAGEGPALATSLERLRRQVARLPWIRARYLHFAIDRIDISATDAHTRAVLLIGPNRLQRMVARLERVVAIVDSRSDLALGLAGLVPGPVSGFVPSPVPSP